MGGSGWPSGESIQPWNGILRFCFKEYSVVTHRAKYPIEKELKEAEGLARWDYHRKGLGGHLRSPVFLSDALPVEVMWFLHKHRILFTFFISFQSFYPSTSPKHHFSLLCVHLEGLHLQVTGISAILYGLRPHSSTTQETTALVPLLRKAHRMSFKWQCARDTWKASSLSIIWEQEFTSP